MRCHNCGSDKTESDSASGTSYCVDCGTVLEENTIVAEVTFGETSGGKAVLQGSYAGESGRISGGGLFGRNRGREGQEQAIENGRIRISSLAHAVRLPERYREAAQRYYNLAVVNRFTRGRRSDHVAAVFNVFTLGATFLKLCRVLNLSLPHVDPSIYISRFAVALDFGDYTQRVAQDAVRLTQRMDRDWITSGRRPAGVCGACLLMAARMNGFRRTTKEMTYVVKVADITIQKRLYEFKQTESAHLTVHDFRTLWLEKRADPPSFQKNRKIQEETESLSSGVASPYVLESSDFDKENTEAEEEDDTESVGEKRKGKERMSVDPPHKVRALSTVGIEEEETSQTDQDLATLIADDQAGYIPLRNQAYEKLSTEQKLELTAIAKAKVAQEEQELLNPHLEKDAREIADEMESWLNDESKEDEELEEDEGHLSDVDCDEIDAMILTPDEVTLKTKVWYNANKDYLQEMAVRRIMEKDRGGAPYARRNKHKKKKQAQASSPAEAAKQLLEKKKLSKKINQAVFDDMFESPESIAKIKARDTLKKMAAGGGNAKNMASSADVGEYEVVEEPGDVDVVPVGKASNDDDDDDDEDMDSDDMADDERFMRDARANYTLDEVIDYDDYGDDNDDDY
ncbi:hypothetical protein FB192DRAFT_1321666 [Mucor lusitanicus]|uniref:B-related factor 1 n=1 Tax=Mucor circinelloides f. lusitanicus TaxID=29924 RepID=A0A8H4F710_MUCCL|nr:hypothetical protein FB192DRAFT_1321666 [Mucor lusitanicus]